MEVSDILDEIDIVDYMSQYLEFEERGGEFWALSPFKEEHTPSFSVRREQSFFYDFSAGVGGNLIDFVMRYHNMTLAESVRHLKQYAGINEEDEESDVIKRLSSTKIAKRFRKKAKPSKQSVARVVPDEYMARFQFDWDKLEPWANEGIEWEVMHKFGVAYDPFDDRIVYPVRNHDGEIITVCGRTCDPDFKARKIRKYTYYQQVGTIDLLYGLSVTLPDILEKKEIILFEGAKSVMKAYGWGYRNCCALLTSHLNDNQLNTLIRLANAHGVRVVFALDADVDILKDGKIGKLRHFANVEWVQNKYCLLADKDAPVDRGLEVFERLYAERRRL